MPAGKTYIKIASQTLSSTATSVTFSNLPQNFTDLVVVVNASINSTNTPALALRINGDSGNSYSSTMWEGNGSSVYATRYSGNRTLMQLNYYTAFYSSIVGSAVLNIFNYSSTTMYKTVTCRFNRMGTTAEGVAASVGWYRGSLAAVTSISISPDFGSIAFAAGSIFTVYGIECAKTPKADGGDMVYTDGTYWYHRFNSSGLFTPRVALTADYLVVAGGGPGGGEPTNRYAGGGGGAGGMRCTVTATGGGGSLPSALSMAGSIGYAITVGAGGSPTTSRGSNGSSSSISGYGIIDVTTVGGGAGGSADETTNSTGVTGGSGGGGGGDGGDAGGSGTANQGYAGGTSASNSGGGGGGAGATGGNASVGIAGNGGSGVTSGISGTSTTYAGGGGGGAGSGAGTAGNGGSGGGGAGGYGSAGSGSPNTGGGGGGVGEDNPKPGGAGGSGIVIIRYAV